MTEHAARAAEFVKDDARLHWHDQAVWFVRNKRDIARSFVPEWEELRSLGSQIKAHTLSKLPEYLERFEQRPVPSRFPRRRQVAAVLRHAAAPLAPSTIARTHAVSAQFSRRKARRSWDLGPWLVTTVRSSCQSGSE